MKKYIPYIVILLLTYLVVGFVKMQFNPAYWKISERVILLYIFLCATIIYSTAKVMLYNKE